MEMNQSCCGIRGKFGMHGTFAYFSTRQLVTELRHRAHGSVFDTITRDTFTGVDVTCFRFPRTRSYDIFLYPFQFGSRVHRPKNESSRFRFLDERGFSTTQTSGQIEGRMGLETAEHHAPAPAGLSHWQRQQLDGEARATCPPYKRLSCLSTIRSAAVDHHATSRCSARCQRDGCPQTHCTEDSPGKADCEVRPLDDRTLSPRPPLRPQRDSAGPRRAAYGMGD